MKTAPTTRADVFVRVHTRDRAGNYFMGETILSGPLPLMVTLLDTECAVSRNAHEQARDKSIRCGVALVIFANIRSEYATIKRECVVSVYVDGHQMPVGLTSALAELTQEEAK